MLPPPLKNLIDQLTKLPEIGPRAASRLAFFLLNQKDQDLKKLAQAIDQLKAETKICSICFNLTSSSNETSNSLCSICADPKRDKKIICLVEDILDILPIERTRQYQGVYHVLGGLIAPTEGITPEKLHIKELINRIRNQESPNRNNIEVILALNPTTEGDTTALYLERALKPLNVKISRLGRGLSTGSDLEYADETTLINALKNRK